MTRDSRGGRSVAVAGLTTKQLVRALDVLFALDDIKHPPRCHMSGPVYDVFQRRWAKRRKRGHRG